MMIRTIDIQNFRCFKHLHTNECGLINVIVGDNGSGKTSLIEGIFMALGVTPEIGLRFRQWRGLDNSFNAPPQRIQEAIWKDLFHLGQWNNEISVKLSGDGPEARSVRIHRGRSQLTIPLSPGMATEESRTAPITFEWTDYEGKQHVTVPRIDATGFHVDGVDEDNPDFFYFASNNVIGSAENANRFSEMRRAGRGQEFVRLLTREYSWITDLDIEVVSGAPVIYAKTKNSKEMMPIAYISGGVNRIVGILLAIASRDRSVVLVDEIEDGLFHTHHVSVWRAILRLCRNYSGQIFATTHSYEWLRALINAAGKNTDDIRLWRLDRGKDNIPNLFSFDGGTLKDAIEYGAEARGL